MSEEMIAMLITVASLAALTLWVPLLHLLDHSIRNFRTRSQRPVRSLVPVAKRIPNLDR